MLLKYGKIIRYLISGSTAALVNMGVLFVSVEYFQLWYIIASSVAFVFGVITSYSMHKFWTFKDKNTEGMHLQFFQFTGFALLMLGLNALLMYVLVDLAGVWYMLAQFINIVLTSVLNFTFFNKVVFNTNTNV